MKHNTIMYRPILSLFVFFILITGHGQASETKTEIRTLSILPFKINASEKLPHIQDGIIQMLYSRLSWRNHVEVVPPATVKTYLSEMKKTSKSRGIDDIARLFILSSRSK